jgi:hypothetical protein
VDKQTFINRIRQLLINDKNAYSIYNDVSSKSSDQSVLSIVSVIATDEAKHIETVSGMLDAISGKTDV